MNSVYCPYCGQDNSLRKQKRDLLNGDKIYTKKCNKCNKIFQYKMDITVFYHSVKNEELWKDLNIKAPYAQETEKLAV